MFSALDDPDFFERDQFICYSRELRKLPANSQIGSLSTHVRVAGCVFVPRGQDALGGVLQSTPSEHGGAALSLRPLRIES